MNKIIIGLVFVGILIASVWWFVFHKNQPSASQPGPNQSAYTLPIDSGASSTQVEPSVKFSERIKSRFDDFVANQQSANTWTKFTENGQVIRIQDALSALDSRIEPNVLQLLDDRMWQLYTCTDTVTKGSVRDVVLSLHFALQKKYQGNLYLDQTRNLNFWERSLLTDVGSVIYPSAYYGTQPAMAGQFTVTQPKSVHTAPIQFSDKTKGTISYIFIGDELLVGSNEKCLLRAQELLYDTSV